MNEDKITQTEEKIKLLDSAISCLDQSLGELENNLGNVLRKPTDVAAKTKDENKEILVPLAMHLNEMYERVEHLNSFVINMMTRLEV